MLSNRLKYRMIIASLLGSVFCIAGLWISYSMNIASGASIVILSVTCYLLFWAVRSAYLRYNRKRIEASQATMTGGQTK